MNFVIKLSRIRVFNECCDQASADKNYSQTSTIAKNSQVYAKSVGMALSLRQVKQNFRVNYVTYLVLNSQWQNVTNIEIRKLSIAIFSQMLGKEVLEKIW